MSRPASHEDANLILRLFEERREPRMRHARDWFVRNFRYKTVKEFFDACPLGSEENASARMVGSYWEMVASFITSGILHEELFFQSGRELVLCYLRLRPILAEMREANKDPFLYTNLETVAKRFEEYATARAPEAFAAFAQRVS
ncbi:MAG: hypothetical protein ACKV22_26345 [Bryobacteraceae bacterium]